MKPVKIIIATHGDYGRALIQSAEMIIGSVDNVYSISLTPEKSFEDFLLEAETLLKENEPDANVFAFVDLFGGTPSNVLTVLTKKYQHEVIAGVNLPMFVDFYLKTREISQLSKNDRLTIVEQLLRTGNESIVHTNSLIEI